MKTNFEPPVHTFGDMVERDMTLFMPGRSALWKRMLSQSKIPEYRKIGENMILTESWSQYYALIRNDLLSRGTHAMIKTHLGNKIGGWATDIDPDQGVTIISTEYKTLKGKYKYNHGRGFYRGQRVVLDEHSGQGGYLTNKKWHLNEVDLLLVELPEIN